MQQRVALSAGTTASEHTTLVMGRGNAVEWLMADGWWLLAAGRLSVVVGISSLYIQNLVDGGRHMESEGF